MRTAAEVRAMAEKLTRDLFDQGKIIEGGWVGFRLMVLPPHASQVQIDEMRKAFFAGSQHLMASIMNVLEPGDEPSDADLRRMDMIAKELAAFETELAASIPTQGRG